MNKFLFVILLIFYGNSFSFFDLFENAKKDSIENAKKEIEHNSKLKRISKISSVFFLNTMNYDISNSFTLSERGSKKISKPKIQQSVDSLVILSKLKDKDKIQKISKNIDNKSVAEKRLESEFKDGISSNMDMDISYEVTIKSNVRIDIYKGQDIVRHLEDNEKGKGSYTSQWDGTNDVGKRFAGDYTCLITLTSSSGVKRFSYEVSVKER